MPRRMIDPEIWRNEKMGSLADVARLLFIGIFSNADDDGRLKASPKFLKATIFPYDNDKTNEHIKELRDQCNSLGLIRVYSKNGNEYLDIPHWTEHQRIRKDRYTPSKIPSITEADLASPLNQPIEFEPQFPVSSKQHQEWGEHHTLVQLLKDNSWRPTGEDIKSVETNVRLGNRYADIVAVTSTRRILIEVKAYAIQPRDLGQVIGYKRDLEKRLNQPTHAILIGNGIGNISPDEAMAAGVQMLNLRDVLSTCQLVNTTVETTGKHSIVKSSIVKSSKEPPYNPPLRGEKSTQVDKAKELFNLWNSLGVIKHKKLTGDMTRAIEAASRDFSVAEISQAMKNYAQIVNDEQCFFKYRWTLKDFLKRGLEKFLDLEVALNNYRQGGGPIGKQPRTYLRGDKEPSAERYRQSLE